MLRKKQYTCEGTIVPTITLDDGGASTSEQMMNFLVHPSCSVHDCAAYVGLAKVFFVFFLAFNPSQSPFLS